MKVLIAGATGYVGSNVLLRCILDPSISRVVVLSRSPLTGVSVKGQLVEETPGYGDKVQLLIHTNWLEYSPELMKKLEGCDACLWCIGGRHTQISRWPTLEEYRSVSIDYPLALANAFSSHLSPMASDQIPTMQHSSPKFRFVFCSGHAAELDQQKTLWIMAETRKAKGLAEKGLLDIDQNMARFESYSVRPCGIYPEEKTLKSVFLTTFVLPTLRVEELGAVMVHLCKEGFGHRVVLHDEIKGVGREILEREEKV